MAIRIQAATKASVSGFYTDICDQRLKSSEDDILVLQALIFSQDFYDLICHRLEFCFDSLMKTSFEAPNRSEIVDSLLSSLSSCDISYLETLENLNSGSNLAHIWFEIWSIMGIVEGVCWKNGINQAEICKKTVFFPKSSDLATSLLDFLEVVQADVLTYLRVLVKSCAVQQVSGPEKFQVNICTEQTKYRNLNLDIDSDAFSCYEGFISVLKCLINMVPKYFLVQFFVTIIA
jgi:hypothetical protein